MGISEFKDNVAKQMFGMTISEALEKEVCVNCKKPVYFYHPKEKHVTFESSSEGDIYSLAGLKEYGISALCEHCFDKSARGL